MYQVYFSIPGKVRSNTYKVLTGLWIRSSKPWQFLVLNGVAPPLPPVSWTGPDKVNLSSYAWL